MHFMKSSENFASPMLSNYISAQFLKGIRSEHQTEDENCVVLTNSEIMKISFLQRIVFCPHTTVVRNCNSCYKVWYNYSERNYSMCGALFCYANILKNIRFVYTLVLVSWKLWFWVSLLYFSSIKLKEQPFVL